MVSEKQPMAHSMKFSIITPEHSKENIPFLLELYQSITQQTYKNWEWVVYVNGSCGVSDIPDVIRNDVKVRVIQGTNTTINIGEIKNLAFNHGSGDVLVEVDHDDVLTSDCLEELAIAYRDETVGFVYSDNAVLHMTSEFVPYDPCYGWTHQTFEWNGRKLIHMHSFEPSSHNVGLIWYGPDHVRSWRKDVYRKIGGHNPELSICDDQELFMRTYLETKMVRIPKVLYIYRVTGDNTWIARNQAIQLKTVELFHQYGQKLAERDADVQGLLKVDIGGGLNPYPGYFSVDMRDNADLKADLNDGIPLPDNSVGVLNASHIIEHLHDKTKTMREIHRVLAPGGWAFIEVPSTDGRGAFQDPTHVSYWNENSFLYYTDRYYANFIDNKDIRFQQYRKQTWFPNEWLKTINVSVVTAWLVAIKGNMRRLPGELRI